MSLPYIRPHADVQVIPTELYLVYNRGKRSIDYPAQGIILITLPWHEETHLSLKHDFMVGVRFELTANDQCPAVVAIREGLINSPLGRR